MIDLIGLVGIGIAAFAATNIDDILVLMMFFSSISFPVRHVIFGQYLGISLLIGISVAGSLISLVIPTYIIGLMGIVPIAIGVKNLIEIRKKDQLLLGKQWRTQKTNPIFHFLQLLLSHFQMVVTISVFMSPYFQNIILWVKSQLLH